MPRLRSQKRGAVYNLKLHGVKAFDPEYPTGNAIKYSEIIPVARACVRRCYNILRTATCANCIGAGGAIATHICLICS